jgi:hypothetical protein
MRWAPRALLLSALAAFTLGCGESPLLRPEPITDVRLDLWLSAAEGSREHPLTIRGLARNLGTTTVHHMAGCGCDGIQIEIFDAQGAPVATLDPCRPVPACACGSESLTPGAQFERRFTFEGDAYRFLPQEVRCVLEDAPSGTYTVIVQYRPFTSVQETPRTIERGATFRWTRS